MIGLIIVVAIVLGCKAWALDAAQRKDDRRVAHIRKCKVCQTLGYEQGCTSVSIRI